jgi:hypothetical protein
MPRERHTTEQTYYRRLRTEKARRQKQWGKETVRLKTLVPGLSLDSPILREAAV